MRLLLSALLVIGILAGCTDAEAERALANPVGRVAVLAEPGAYAFESQRMDLAQLKEELRHFADAHRHEGLNNSRVRVRISTAPEADWLRTTDLIDFCAGIGVDKVEATGR